MRLSTRARSALVATMAATTALTLLPAAQAAQPVPAVPPVLPGPLSADPPRPGSAGLGDRLFPTLGNGGYDARHYTLRLRYASAADDAGLVGTVVMRARATQALSSLNLDFVGPRVGSVAVDGRPASWTQSRGEMTIYPERPVAAGATFRVRVSDFRSSPEVADPDELLATPFVVTPDGSVTAGQPDGMHRVFPVNDHPRDKASYTVHFDVPRGRTAVANGERTRRRVVGDRVLTTYRQRQPMAAELVSLSVGAFTVIRRRKVGRIAVRDVVPTRLVGRYRPRLAVERAQLRWMQRQVGAYPFRTYGSLVADSGLGFALENQTLSLYDTAWWTYPRGLWEPVMVHELAHQWFGDSVAPRSWSDLWLNEGHATWYEVRYAAQRGLLQDNAGAPTLRALFRGLYADGNRYRALYGPVARPRSGDPVDLFSPQAYTGGALVLYALRQRVGDRAFERIQRAWVSRGEGRSRSTGAFVRLARRGSQRPIGPFLRRWLYGTTTPAMPGHPGWRVDPVTRRGQRELRQQARAGTMAGLPASWRLER